MPLRTIEAHIDKSGKIHLDEAVCLSGPRKVIVTILDDDLVPETALLSEANLAEDWLLEEEDTAWNHLQKGQ